MGHSMLISSDIYSTTNDAFISHAKLMVPSTITNSIYTRIQMAIVDCVELALNVGYERIWFSRIRVEF